MNNIVLTVDGQIAIDADINLPLIIKLLRGASVAALIQRVPKSTPISTDQARELLARVDEKSAHFLKQLAANGGEMTWGEMRKLFGIGDVQETSAFTNRYGKGITRALRHLLGDKSARLVWWDDFEWVWDDLDKVDGYKVYMDGPALRALQEATAN